jgi:hypothetical protein
VTGLSLRHDEHAGISLIHDGTELFRYMYEPREAALESPKPFLHPMRTLSGELVSLYRPHDHIWHKGLYFGIANFGDHNVWGGHTWVTGSGYVTWQNHGRIRHLGFDRVELRDSGVDVVERLRWDGADCAATFPAADERRILRARVFDDGWVLGFDVELTNADRRSVAIGSPTTRGRHAAGYGGLFWRGPRSFTGTAEVVTPDAIGGDELMGCHAPWLALRGRHDGDGAASTLVFADAVADDRLPVRWFVRVNPYACVGTAPFFDTEYDFTPGDTLRFAYRVVVADGLLDPAECAALERAAQDALPTTSLSATSSKGQS